MVAPPQKVFKKWARRGENELVCLDFWAILTGQGDISKLDIGSPICKGKTGTFLKAIPFETEFIDRAGHFGFKIKITTWHFGGM